MNIQVYAVETAGIFPVCIYLKISENLCADIAGPDLY